MKYYQLGIADQENRYEILSTKDSTSGNTDMKYCQLRIAPQGKHI